MTPARLARAALVFWLLSEGMHALASRALLPRRGRAAIEGDPTVIVLGFRNRHPERINAVNRWRADVAVRSLPAQPTRLIATGGSRAKGMSEAALIAAYLVEVHGMDSKTIVTEEASLSTWENIANVRPLLAGTGAVMIVSNPLHALRARWYVRMQDPDLARRLVRARDHRGGEHAWAKPLLTAYGLRDLLVTIAGLRGRAPGEPPVLDARVAHRRRQPRGRRPPGAAAG